MIKALIQKKGGDRVCENFSRNIETQFGYLGAMMKFPAISLLSLIFP